MEMNGTPRVQDPGNTPKNEFAILVFFLGYVLMSLGLIGNSLWLVVLHRSRALRTPHFIYYKMLSWSELVCCGQFFVDQIIQIFATRFDPAERRQVFHSKMAALTVGVIARVVYSSTGYLSSYALLAITLDRFLAIWKCMWYQVVSNRRKRRFAYKYAACCVVVSVVVHSWYPYIENSVIVNGSTVLIGRAEFESEPLLNAIMLMKVYNGFARLLQPIVLICVTAAVIVGIRRYGKGRQNTLGKYGTVGYSPMRPSQKNLIAMMLVVVVLCLIETVPREVRRLMSFVNDSDHSERTGILRTADECMRVLANLGAQIDRALTFYTCVLLSKMFRKETFRSLCPRCYERVESENRSRILSERYATGLVTGSGQPDRSYVTDPNNLQLSSVGRSTPAFLEHLYPR